MTTESLGNPARGTGRLADAGPRRCPPASWLLSSPPAEAPPATTPGRTRSLVLYTCLSDESIQPVIEAFEARDDGGQVDLFRAPTGELNARVAADARSGGLRADVIWGCDPLTVQAFVDQDLVGGWTPPEADAIPEDLRTEDYVGAHVLYMVALHRTDVPAPAGMVRPDRWRLRRPGRPRSLRRRLRPRHAGLVRRRARLRDRLLPRPAGQRRRPGQHARRRHDRRGPGHLRRRDRRPPTPRTPRRTTAPPWTSSGRSPARWRSTGRSRWPRDSADSDVAKSFISFVVGEEGQTVLGESGAYPTLPGVDGPTVPDGAPVVSPDWAAHRRGQGRDPRRVPAGLRRLRMPARWRAVGPAVAATPRRRRRRRPGRPPRPATGPGAVAGERRGPAPAPGLARARHGGAQHRRPRRRGHPGRRAARRRDGAGPPAAGPARPGVLAGRRPACRSSCPTSCWATAGPRPTRAPASPTPRSGCPGRACSGRSGCGWSSSSTPRRWSTWWSPSGSPPGPSRTGSGPPGCPAPAPGPCWSRSRSAAAPRRRRGRGARLRAHPGHVRDPPGARRTGRLQHRDHADLRRPLDRRRPGLLPGGGRPRPAARPRHGRLRRAGRRPPRPAAAHRAPGRPPGRTGAARPAAVRAVRRPPCWPATCS